MPAPADVDDALRGAQRGDETATTTLYRALQPQLLRYVRHQLPDACEDVAAEAWLAAARGLPSFDGDAAAFRAFLFTIARRRITDHFRTRGRRPRTVELADAEPPATPDPAEIVVGALSSDEAVAALVRDLPPDQAEVLLLRVVAGLGVDEVAAVMNRTPGSVRVLQHRALRRLARDVEAGTVTR